MIYNAITLTKSDTHSDTRTNTGIGRVANSGFNMVQCSTLHNKKGYGGREGLLLFVGHHKTHTNRLAVDFFLEMPNSLSSHIQLTFQERVVPKTLDREISDIGNVLL